MQVLLAGEEYRVVQRTAKLKGLTVAEWVRQALRDAAREVPSGNTERKLSAVREAARHQFPAPEIDQMLNEIEAGYPRELN